MWQNLIGTPGYAAPVSGAGTVTVPSGAFVHIIAVHASAGSATVAIFGGAAIPIVNGAPPLVLQFNHSLWLSNQSNSGAIVFVNTDMAVVHWVRQGNV